MFRLLVFFIVLHCFLLPARLGTADDTVAGTEDDLEDRRRLDSNVGGWTLIAADTGEALRKCEILWDRCTVNTALHGKNVKPALQDYAPVSAPAQSVVFTLTAPNFYYEQIAPVSTDDFCWAHETVLDLRTIDPGNYIVSYVFYDESNGEGQTLFPSHGYPYTIQLMDAPFITQIQHVRLPDGEVVQTEIC